MSFDRRLTFWTLALSTALALGGCGPSTGNAPEVTPEPRRDWEVASMAAENVDLRLSETPGRVMGRGETVRVTSRPLPLFNTVPIPRLEKRVSPRRPGPREPEGSPTLPKRFVSTGAGDQGEAFAVRQYAPVGEVERPREIRLLFSEDVAGAMAGALLDEVPIAITPKVAGQWRWLDPRALAFTPTRPFPPATTFEVEVAAAFQSARGEKLSEGAQWRFSTGGAQLVGIWPDPGEDEAALNDWPRDAPLLLAFDRPVTAEDVRGRLALTSETGGHELRALEEAEMARDPLLRDAAARWSKAHRVAFKAARPLPADTEATLTMAFDAALPDESRRLTAFRTEVSFSRAALTCFWAPSPMVRAELAIDARIDRQSLAPEQLRIEPPLAEQSIALVREETGARRGRSVIVVTGQPPPGTTSIKATLRAGARDEEGVTNEADLTAACALSDETPRVWPAAHLQMSPRGELALHATAAMSIELAITPLSEAARAEAIDCLGLKPVGDCLPRGIEPHARRQIALSPPESAAMTGGQKGLEPIRVDLSEHFAEGVNALFVTLSGQGVEGGPVFVAREQNLIFAEQIGASVVTFVVSAGDGTPRPGVEVRLVEKDRRVRRAMSDGEGVARFEDVEGAAVRVEAGNTFAPVFRESPTPHLLTPLLAHRPGDAIRLGGVVFPRGEAARLSIEIAGVGIDARQPPRALAAIDKNGRFDHAIRLPKRVPDGAVEVRLRPVDTRGAPVGQTTRALIPVGHWQRGEGLPRLSVLGDEVLPRDPLLFQLDEEAAEQPDRALGWRVEATTAALGFGDLPGFVFGDGRQTWARPPAWARALDEGDICRADGRVGRISTLLGGITASAESGEGWPLELTASVRGEESPMRPRMARGLVQPAARLVGLRAKRAFWRQGETADIEVVVVDLGGQIAPGHTVDLQVVALRPEPWLGGQRLREKIAFAETLRSGTMPIKARIRLDERALHRVVARVRDGEGRVAQSEIDLWVEGAPALDATLEQGAGGELFFESGTDGARSGELLARLPNPPQAAWIVLVSSGGHLFSQSIQFRGSPDAGGFQSALVRLGDLRLPWSHGEAPIAAQLVTFDGARFHRLAERLLAGRERPRPSGEVALQRNLKEARRPHAQVLRDGTPLEVAIHAQRGQSGSFLIEVRDALGHPVPEAEVLVTVADDGRTADMAAFGTRVDPLGEERPTASGPVFASQASLPFAQPRDRRVCVAATGEHLDRVHEGEAFRLRHPRPWSVASAATETRWLKTDRAGQARFVRGESQAPSSRLHVSAFERRFGRRGQASVALDERARVDLRLDLPRFVRPGDQPIARFTLDNPLSRDVEARLDLRAAGAWLSPREDSKLLTLPPNSQVEVVVPLKLDAGASAVILNAELRALGRQKRVSGRAEVVAELAEKRLSGPLPKGAHGIDIAFTRGSRSKRGFLELEVADETSLALAEAWRAVATHPMPSDEAEIAFLFALGSLGERRLAMIEPDAAVREAHWRRAREVVAAWMANWRPEGRFEWQGETGARGEFLTLFALDALSRLDGAWPRQLDAQMKLSARVRSFLSKAEALFARLLTESQTRPDVPSETADALMAYALHLRHRLRGPLDADTRQTAIALAERLLTGATGEPIAWLLPALATSADFETLARRFEERMLSDGHGTHAPSAFRDGGRDLFHAEHRADAVALDALTRLKRAPKLRDRLTRGLLSHRDAAGRWANLQENTWAVAALAALPHDPAPTPVRAWFDGYLGEQRLSRDRPVARWRFPLELLPDNADRRRLVVDNRAEARLAWRLVWLWNDPREDVIDEGTSLRRTLSPEGGDRLERDVRSEVLLRTGRRLRAAHALHLSECESDLVLRSPTPAGLAALTDELKLDLRDCQGRPARVRLKRTPEAIELRVFEAGKGEHLVEERWLATQRGDFEAPATSLSIGGERRAVGGSVRIRVE